MITAENLANAMQLEKRGVYALIWDDKGELVRALIVFLAALRGMKIKPILMSSVEEAEKKLRLLFETQPPARALERSKEAEVNAGRDKFLLLFLQQAAGKSIGPIVNGWRTALADSPGTLLVARSADFTDFQRAAPDLFSFVGPKCADSASMLSIWSHKIAQKMQLKFPESIEAIIKQLPGEKPSLKELREWFNEHPAVNNGEKERARV